MADKKVNVRLEESKPPEATASSGPGDPPAPEYTEGPTIPGVDQAAPSHADHTAREHTHQAVLSGMGKVAPVKEGGSPAPEIKLLPTPEMPPRPVKEGKIIYLKMAEVGQASS